LTRRRSDGEDPDRERNIEEIPLQGAYTGVSGSRWDLALVGIFGVAILGGLMIAAGKAIGQGDAGSSGVAAATASASGQAAPTVGPTPDAWLVNAVDHRGANGERFSYACPPNGSGSHITGTGTYTDDSSVCSAGVHAGVITFEAGGTVVIEISPGRNGYLGSMQNRIASFHSSERAPGSFVVVGAPTPAWGLTAVEHRGAIGQQFTYECPPRGDAYPIWGTGTYTDDSSICTAAVHRGIISLTYGGTVTIEIRPGRARYQRTRQNGITSSRWGPWDGSFGFVQAYGLPY
jgi:hypothetical protein